MTISAKVIADSCQQHLWEGIRPANYHLLTTFELRYPRFIHAELMTHRVFSRNASSSRAIPIAKLIDEVWTDPAMPVFWGKNQAGMQAAEELSSVAPGAFDPLPKDGDPVPMHPNEHYLSPKYLAKEEWLKARNMAVMSVQKLMEIGLHKQLANRLLEPWSHITVLVTSTDWANWYALRHHPAAQPEMQLLASTMLAAHRLSMPRVLAPGQWHLPYVGDAEPLLLLAELPDLFTNFKSDGTSEPVDPLLFPKISSGRCARVSYLKHDGTEPDPEDDLGLFGRLMGGVPKHASPTEHQARVPISGIDTLVLPAHDVNVDAGILDHLRSNLYGWVQHRKLVPGENTTSYEEFDR